MNRMNGGHYGTVLQGPEAVAAASQVRADRASKGAWPYPWVFPPPGAVRVTAGSDASGTLAVPAAATPTQGLLYTVDEGFQFALERLVVMFLNDAAPVGIPTPGAFLWSLTLNQPVGTSSFQGSSVQGFTAVDVPLGTLQIPWPLESAEMFGPGDSIRSVITNVSLGVGAPNFIKTILLGWKWPVL